MGGCGQRLAEVLAGRSLAGACRKGKYLWLQLDGGEGGGGGPWPVLHFGKVARQWVNGPRNPTAVWAGKRGGKIQ